MFWRAHKVEPQVHAKREGGEEKTPDKRLPGLESMNYQGQARLSALQRSALSPAQRQDHCAPKDKGGFLLKMKEEEEEDKNEKKNENEEGVGVGEVVERE